MAKVTNHERVGADASCDEALARLHLSALKARIDVRQENVIRHQGRSITFDQLLANARRIAGTLPPRRLNAAPEIIAIVGEASLETVTAIYGVLIAGHTFSCLDADLPLERVRSLARLAKFALVLFGAGVRQEVTEAFRREGFQCREVPPIGSLGGDPSFIPIEVPVSDCAYVLFTSGSTGEPKGACVSWLAAARAQAMYQRELRLGDRDCVANETLLSCDVATFDVFALLTGASLSLPPRAGIGETGSDLAAFLESAEATVMFTVPSVIRALLSTVDPCPADQGLRVIAMTGETVSPTLVRDLRRRWPGTQIRNLFGMTEAPYLLADCLSGEEPGNLAPNTFPFPDTCDIQLSILQAGDLVPIEDVKPGTRGELHIGGTVLFNGYLDECRRALRERVTPARGFGDIFEVVEGRRVRFLGRRQRIAKIWGVTVFLDWIETTLERCPVVRRAAVVSAEAPGLLAFIEPKDASADPSAVIDAVRSWSNSVLDRYEAPQEWMVVERLPLTRTGKIDRKALGSLQ